MINDYVKRLLFLVYLCAYGNSNRFLQVIEHQKSGGTWLSRILSEYYGIPFVSRPTYYFPVSSLVRVHAYRQYTVFPKRQIYVIRDGRDVLTSYYFHQIIRLKIPQRKIFDSVRDAKKNMPIFLQNYFAHRMGNNCTWPIHVKYWLLHARYLIKYEEMIENTFRCVSKLIEAFGEKVDGEVLKKAVDNNSFERLSGRRRGQEDISKFHRKGIVGDWKNYFNLEARHIFKGYAGTTLLELGYELDESWVDLPSTFK